MKDIAADKIISFLSANNIFYQEKGTLINFYIKHNGSSINIFYQNKRFYIDKKNYVGQPHIIPH